MTHIKAFCIECGMNSDFKDTVVSSNLLKLVKKFRSNSLPDGIRMNINCAYFCVFNI